MKNKIKMKAGFTTDIARQERRLARRKTQAQGDIRAALRRARRHAIEHANGNPDAYEDMRDELAHAVEIGMDPKAITVGGNMAKRIGDLLGEVESQSHAVGLLLGASDMLATVNADDAATIQAIADKYATPDANQWRDIATPTRRNIK